MPNAHSVTSENEPADPSRRNFLRGAAAVAGAAAIGSFFESGNAQAAEIKKTPEMDQASESQLNEIPTVDEIRQIILAEFEMAADEGKDPKYSDFVSLEELRSKFFGGQEQKLAIDAYHIKMKMYKTLMIENYGKDTVRQKIQEKIDSSDVLFTKADEALGKLMQTSRDFMYEAKEFWIQSKEMANVEEAVIQATKGLDDAMKALKEMNNAQSPTEQTSTEDRGTAMTKANEILEEHVLELANEVHEAARGLADANDRLLSFMNPQQ